MARARVASYLLGIKIIKIHLARTSSLLASLLSRTPAARPAKKAATTTGRIKIRAKLPSPPHGHFALDAERRGSENAKQRLVRKLQFQTDCKETRRDRCVCRRGIFFCLDWQLWTAAWMTRVGICIICIDGETKKKMVGRWHCNIAEMRRGWRKKYREGCGYYSVIGILLYEGNRLHRSPFEIRWIRQIAFNLNTRYTWNPRMLEYVMLDASSICAVTSKMLFFRHFYMKFNLESTSIIGLYSG